MYSGVHGSGVSGPKSGREEFQEKSVPGDPEKDEEKERLEKGFISDLWRKKDNVSLSQEKT